MSSFECTEIHAIINFYHDLGKTPTQTLKMITEINRNTSVTLIFKWHRWFSYGQTVLKKTRGEEESVNVAMRR